MQLYRVKGIDRAAEMQGKFSVMAASEEDARRAVVEKYPRVEIESVKLAEPAEAFPLHSDEDEAAALGKLVDAVNRDEPAEAHPILPDSPRTVEKEDSPIRRYNVVGFYNWPGKRLSVVATGRSEDDARKQVLEKYPAFEIESVKVDETPQSKAATFPTLASFSIGGLTQEQIIAWLVMGIIGLALLSAMFSSGETAREAKTRWENSEDYRTPEQLYRDDRYGREASDAIQDAWDNAR